MDIYAPADPDILTLRAIKADRLVDAFRGKGIGPREAAKLTERARREIEQQAGIRISSPATWRTAVGMHAGSTRISH